MSLWIKPLSVTIQVKATEQYFLVVLLIMLYKVVRTFESVHEILKCDYSDTLLAVLSGGAMYFSKEFRSFERKNYSSGFLFPYT